MKRILLLPAILLLLVSCTDSALPLFDLLRSFDRTLPRVLSYSLEENKAFTITFSENVELLDLVVGGEKRKGGTLGSTFTIPLPHVLSPGETLPLALTVRKANGNTTRAYFTLSGINRNLPGLLLNEVSTKGTSTSPDRVELLVTLPGDTAGVTLTEGLDGFSYTLPSLAVETNDLIVIYWNIRTAKTREDREDGGVTWYLNASATATLPGTTGSLLLRETKDGTVMDALVYGSSSLESYSGYGDKATEKAALLLIKDGEWSGEAVDTTLVTSSRVLARLPGAVDTSSAADWFTTAARKSTFGTLNTYSPYAEE